jgi:hypothetical protein
LVALIAIAAASRSARALTSTNAITPPRRATRSISPPDHETLGENPVAFDA